MIRFVNLNYFQNMRYVKDVVEPLAVSILKKQNHTFFVHRCSDYNDIHHLAKCHSYTLARIDTKLLENHWSAIDVILFRVKGTPQFSRTKEYFDKLREMLVSTKEVEDFEIYEVKLTKENSEIVLSYKTYSLHKSLQSIGKDLHIFQVFNKGYVKIETSQKKAEQVPYTVRTHYGREGYYLDLGSK